MSARTATQKKLPRVKHLSSKPRRFRKLLAPDGMEGLLRAEALEAALKDHPEPQQQGPATAVSRLSLSDYPGQATLVKGVVQNLAGSPESMATALPLGQQHQREFQIRLIVVRRKPYQADGLSRVRTDHLDLPAGISNDRLRSGSRGLHGKRTA